MPDPTPALWFDWHSQGQFCLVSILLWSTVTQYRLGVISWVQQRAELERVNREGASRAPTLTQIHMTVVHRYLISAVTWSKLRQGLSSFLMCARSLTIIKVGKDLQDHSVQPSTYHQYFLTKPCPLVQYLNVSWIPPGMVTPAAPWAAHFSTRPPFNRINVS